MAAPDTVLLGLHDTLTLATAGSYHRDTGEPATEGTGSIGSPSWNGCKPRWKRSRPWRWSHSRSRRPPSSSLLGCIPGRSGGGSPTRSHWPAGSHPRKDPAASTPPGTSSWTCPTRWSSSAAATSTAGPSGSSPNRPPTSTGPPAPPWTPSLAARRPGTDGHQHSRGDREAAGLPSGPGSGEGPGRESPERPSGHAATRPGHHEPPVRAAPGRTRRRLPRRPPSRRHPVARPTVTPRSKGQIMADTLVERLTGQDHRRRRRGRGRHPVPLGALIDPDRPDRRRDPRLGNPARRARPRTHRQRPSPGLVAATVHPTHPDRRADRGRSRPPPAPVHRLARRTHPLARLDLPRPLLRRPDPPPRPPPPPPRRRPHHPHQRPRRVRTRKLRPRAARLVDPTRSTPTPTPSSPPPPPDTSTEATHPNHREAVRPTSSLRAGAALHRGPAR